MILSDALVWVSVPFVATTVIFGFLKGDNDYYDSDAYEGHGTAHPVKLEETTCERMVKASDLRMCDLPEVEDGRTSD
tara:strand:- start:1555 stop:1785 length:231 start_codon:yes stop_codon:yes gene_type:complete